MRSTETNLWRALSRFREVPTLFAVGCVVRARRERRTDGRTDGRTGAVMGYRRTSGGEPIGSRASSSSSSSSSSRCTLFALSVSTRLLESNRSRWDGHSTAVGDFMDFFQSVVQFSRHCCYKERALAQRNGESVDAAVRRGRGDAPVAAVSTRALTAASRVWTRTAASRKP